MAQITTTVKRDGNILIPLLAATFLTLFLFYIDEGYYNFKWMHDPGNWVAFGIYVSLLFLPQLLTLGLYYWLLSPLIRDKELHVAITIVLSLSGMVLGLVTAFSLLG